MFRAATLWRRISPFSLFLMDQRRNPSLAGLPIVQRGKLLSQMYKTLPLDKRANLERRAEAHPSFATATTTSRSLQKSRPPQEKSGTKRRLAPRNHKWKAQGRKEQKVLKKILLKSNKNKKGSGIEPPTSNRKTTTTTTSLKGSSDKKHLKKIKTLTFQQYAKRHIGKVRALHDSKRMAALSKMFQLKKPVVIQGAHGKRMTVEPCQTLEVTVKERLKKYEPPHSSRPNANANGTGVRRASASGGMLTRSKTNKGSAIQWSRRTPFSPSSTTRGITVGGKSSARRLQGLAKAKPLPRKRSVGDVKRITAVPSPASPHSPPPTTRGQAIWLMKKEHPPKTKDKAAGTVTGRGSSAKGSLVKARAKASLPRPSSNPDHHSGNTNASVISTKQVQQLLDRAVRRRPPASPSPTSLASLGSTASGNQKKGSNTSSLRRAWFTSNARSEKRSGKENNKKRSTMFPQIISALPRERRTTNNRKTSLQNVGSGKGIKMIRVSPRGTFSPQKRQQASLRQSKSTSTTSPFSTPMVSSARSSRKIKATNRRLKNPFDNLS